MLIPAGAARRTILGLLLTLSASVASASSISLTPGSTTANVGDVVSFDVLFDFTSEPTFGGGFEITFSSMLAFNSFTPSPFFQTQLDAFMGMTGNTNGSVAPDSTGGYVITIEALSSSIGQSGSLGILDVTALSPGIGIVNLMTNSTVGSFFSAVTFSDQNVDLTGSQITVSAVPLPGAIWLFISALCGIAGLRKVKASA